MSASRVSDAGPARAVDLVQGRGRPRGSRSGAPDDLHQGCGTQAWLATSEDELAQSSRGYFYHQRPRAPNPIAADLRTKEENQHRQGAPQAGPSRSWRTRRSAQTQGGPGSRAGNSGATARPFPKGSARRQASHAPANPARQDPQVGDRSAGKGPPEPSRLREWLSVRSSRAGHGDGAKEPTSCAAALGALR